MLLNDWLKTMFQHRRVRQPGTGRKRRRPDGTDRDASPIIAEVLEDRALLSDFGDAPDALAGTAAGEYQTLGTDGGAEHVTIDAAIGPLIGATVDDDGAIGFQDTTATADDINGVPNDEDGLAPGFVVMIGERPQVGIPVTNLTAAPAVLAGWIDYDGNGVFDDLTERATALVPPGTDNVTTTLDFAFVPATAPLQTFARFRISSDPGFAAAPISVGAVADGEVEDHAVTITPRTLDFGDAPTSAQSAFANDYPTGLAADGARHVVATALPVNGPRLGATIGPEPDGQPTAAADGDDTNALFDDGVAFPPGDETGVTFAAPLLRFDAADSTGSVTVDVQNAPGVLDVWIDFSQDGDWDDAGENAISARPVTIGANTVSLTIPAGTVVGATFARFRISSTGSPLPTGLAMDGEVEDHTVTILDADAAPPVVVTLPTGLGCRVVRSGGQIVVQLADGTGVTSVPDDSSLTIDGTAANDVCVIDATAGNPIPNGQIVFNGDGGSNAIGFVGDGSNVFVLTPSATTPGTITADLDGQIVTATGLAPVDVSGMASATLDLPNGDDVVDLTNGVDFTMGGTNDAIIATGTSGGVPFEATAFFNNTAVVIDTDATAPGMDTVTIVSADNAHGNLDLTIDTGAVGPDAVRLNGNLSVAGTVILTTSGDVRGAGTLTAAMAMLDSDTGVGTIGSPLNTSVTALSGQAATSGGFFVSNAGVVAIDTVDVLSGVTTAAGDIQISSTLGLTINDPVDSAGLVNLTSALGNVSINDDVTAETDVLIAAVAGSVTQAGSTTIESITAGVSVTAGLNVTADEITAVANTVNGGADAIKILAAGVVTLNGPLTATANPDLNIDVDPTDVNVNADMTATGDIDITASNNVTVAAGVTIQADSDGLGGGTLNITADDATDPVGAGDLIANATSVLQGHTVNLDGFNVTTGIVTADVGDVTVTAANSITFNGAVTATLAQVVATAAAGNVSINDDVTAETDVLIAATAGGVLQAGGTTIESITAGVSITAGLNVTAAAITAVANTVNGGADAIKISAGGVVTLNGPLTATANPDLNIDVDPTDVNVNADVTATGDIDITASYNVTVAAGVTIQADSDGLGGGTLNITADDATDPVGAGDLIANATSVLQGHTVNLDGFNVTTGIVTADVGDVTVTAANSITFNGAVTATLAQVVATAAAGNVNINDDVTAAVNVDVEATAGSVNQAAGTNILAGGNVELDGGTSVDLDGTIGAGTAIGGDVLINTNLLGAVLLGDDITADGAVTIGHAAFTGGAVTIGSAATITSDADLAGAEDVTVRASASITQAVGSTLNANLGAVFVRSTTGLVTINGATSSGSDQLSGITAANPGMATIQIWGHAAVTASGVDASAGNGTVEVRSNIAGILLGDINAGTANVYLQAGGGAITDGNGPALNVTAAGLATTSVTGTGSANAIETAVSTYAGINSVSNNLQVTNSVGGLLTIGTVGNLSGITNAGANITLRNLGPILVSTPVLASGGGNILIAAEGTASTDTLTVAANITAMGGNGNVLLFAGSHVLYNSSLISAAGAGDVSLSAGENFNGGANQAGFASADVIMTDGLLITSATGTVSLEATNNVAVSIVSTLGNVTVSADDNDFLLADGIGGIFDNLTGEAANVIAAVATFTSAQGIGSADDLETNVTAVDAQNAGTIGDIRLNEIAAGTNIAVLRLDQTNAANAGLILLTTEDGDIVLRGAGMGGTGVSVAGSGSVTLDANVINAVATPGRGDVRAGAPITTAGGAIFVLADHDILAAATAPIASGGGNVTLTADADTTLFGGNTDGTIDFDATIAAGAGVLTFRLTDLDGAVDGDVLSTSNLIMAGPGALNLNGAGNTYAGTTTVNAGTLLVNGTIVGPGGDVNVNSGATLGGDGTIGTALMNRNVIVNSGATLDPGMLQPTPAPPGTGTSVPGRQTVNGDVTFLAGSTFRIQLGGFTPGPSGHDQLAVNGSPDIGLAVTTLDARLGFTVPIGGVFVIVANDMADPVAPQPNPQFIDPSATPLPEGGTVFIPDAMANPVLFNITYRDDTNGNDIVLLRPGRFDFNASTAVTAPGWEPVAEHQVKTPTNVAGWDRIVPAFDRGLPNALLRDGHFGGFETRTFQVDVLPNETYQVVVIVGDLVFTHDEDRVTVYDAALGPGGGQVQTVTTPLGRFATLVFNNVVIGNSGRMFFDFVNLGFVDLCFVVNAIDIRPQDVVGALSFVRQDALPLSTPVDADGATIDVYQGSGAPQNSFVTISTSNGTVVAADDVNSDVLGVQVMSDAAGNFTFRIHRPANVPNGVITATELTGRSILTATQAYRLAAVRRFDFNAGESPTATGFIGVGGNDTFTAAVGYGWDVPANTVDRPGLGLSDLRRDLHFGINNTFRVVVAPGASYDVRYYFGDGGASHDHVEGFIEGAHRFSVPSLPAGTFVVQQVAGVSSTDSVLELRLNGFAGVDRFFPIVGLEVATSGNLPAPVPLHADPARAVSEFNPTSGRLTVNVLEGSTVSVQVVDGTVRIVANGAAEPQFVTIPASSVTSIVVNGSDENDTLDVSGVSRSTLENLAGVTLLGHAGDDTLIGGLDNDVLDGGDGDDAANGGAGNDFLSGGAGHDLLLGGAGRDVLNGGTGNDRLRGQGGGGDTLTGGAGDDTLDGGAGTDAIVESADTDFTLADSQLLGLGTDALVSIERAYLSGGRGSNRINASGFSGYTHLNGGAGDDLLIGGRGVDLLNGSSGNDTLYGAAGDDILLAGSGNDLAVGGGGADSVLGQGGSRDSLAGGSGTGTDDGDRVIGSVAEVDETFALRLATIMNSV